MPVKPFQPVCLNTRKKHRGRPPKSKHQPTLYRAQVSQATRDRLFNEALVDPAYEGMPAEEVRQYVNQKIDETIKDYPWWYGHLPMDQPKKPLSEAQRQHIERMNRRKIEIKEETDAPYVPTEALTSEEVPLE